MNNIKAVILCMYKNESRMQICLRNPSIASFTDHFSNRTLKEFKFNFKNKGDI
jgi:hypothetical protein